jgi:hypothetical protein
VHHAATRAGGWRAKLRTVGTARAALVVALAPRHLPGAEALAVQLPGRVAAPAVLHALACAPRAMPVSVQSWRACCRPPLPAASCRPSARAPHSARTSAPVAKAASSQASVRQLPRGCVRRWVAVDAMPQVETRHCQGGQGPGGTVKRWVHAVTVAPTATRKRHCASACWSAVLPKARARARAHQEQRSAALVRWQPHQPPPGLQGKASQTVLQSPVINRRVQAPEDRSFRARKEVRSCGASLAADRTGSQGDAGARQQHDGHKVRHGAWCCGRADAGTRQRVGR